MNAAVKRQLLTSYYFSDVSIILLLLFDVCVCGEREISQFAFNDLHISIKNAKRCYILVNSCLPFFVDVNRHY